MSELKGERAMRGVELHAACRGLLAELIDANIKRPES
jgi:hypothetical protein